MWRSLVTLPLPPQELFGKVVPHHCPLHLVPAPPEGREHPAPTIHATHTQFINVVNESITSDSEQDSRGQGPGGGGARLPRRAPGTPSRVWETSLSWRIGSPASQLVSLPPSLPPLTPLPLSGRQVGGSCLPPTSSACPLETRPQGSLCRHCASEGRAPRLRLALLECSWLRGRRDRRALAHRVAPGGRSAIPTLSEGRCG